MSCSKKEITIEGDLYFKLIEVGSYYGAENSTIEKMEKSIDSIRHSSSPDQCELDLINAIDVLKENGLIKAPWINVKTETSIERIYLSDKEYEKVRNFDRNKLITENKKVQLEIKVVELDSGLYYSENIAKMILVDGKTYWRK